MASKQPIILTDAIIPPPALIRAGLDALPSIIRAHGERASRRFIEIFYCQHSQPQHADGIRAGGKTVLR